MLSGRYKDLPPDAVLGILRVPESGLFGENPTPERNLLLATTLKAAREELTVQMGSDPTQWTWGKLHVVRLSPRTRRTTGRERLARSWASCRRAMSTHPTLPARAIHGSKFPAPATARIIDLSNWDRSWVINTPGQSGQPGSPHYSDLMPVWDAGRYFPLLYSRKAVEGETTDRLTLTP